MKKTNSTNSTAERRLRDRRARCDRRNYIRFTQYRMNDRRVFFDRRDDKEMPELEIEAINCA
ncbi:MAG: hypothetical protein D6B28_05315 [Gammaproteobacteria bacterium]|nr:MAG: hypothetical protein D6B28_05315 [Gammaproteobacteria bacterium]